jgi:RNA polymerase sigma-70 factor, ECF subfamily
MEWTDEAAAAETRRGDRNAFRVLVDRHSRAVFRLAYRMTGNESDAEDVVHEKTPSWIDRIAAREPDPERLMHSGQISRLLQPALEQLSEMERVAFTLRHFEGCNVEEIARALGVQQNAAKHRVFRAVQKLRRALERAWGGTR